MSAIDEYSSRERINNWVCEAAGCRQGGRFKFNSPTGMRNHWMCLDHVTNGIDAGWTVIAVEIEGIGPVDNVDIMMNEHIDHAIIDAFLLHTGRASVLLGPLEPQNLDEKIEALASGDPMPKKKSTAVEAESTAKKPTKPEIKFTVTRKMTGAAASYTLDPPKEVAKIPVRLVCTCLENPEHVKKAENSRMNWDGDVLVAIMRRHDAEITPADWAKALVKAYARQNSIKNEATESSVFAEVDTGYMAMGNLLYEIRPTGIVATNKALITMRKNAAEKIKKEITEIRAGAEEQAKRIRQEADVYAAQQFARASEAEIKLANLKRESSNLAPKWVTDVNLPLKKIGSAWYVGVQCKFQISKWEYKMSGISATDSVKWAAAPGEPYNYLVWAPIGPSFSPTSLKLDNTCGNMPHLTKDKGCMGLGDGPTNIEKADDVIRLSTALHRTFQTVNLMSMLPGGRPADWESRIWAFVPKNLLKALKSSDWSIKLGELAREVQLANAPTPPPTLTINAEGTGAVVLTPAEPGTAQREVITHEEDQRETWTA